MCWLQQSGCTLTGASRLLWLHAAAALLCKAFGYAAVAVHIVCRSSAALTVVPPLQTAGIQQFHAQAQVAKQVAKQVYVQQQLEYGRFRALLEFATVSPAVKFLQNDIKLQLPLLKQRIIFGPFDEE